MSPRPHPPPQSSPSPPPLTRPPAALPCTAPLLPPSAPRAATSGAPRLGPGCAAAPATPLSQATALATPPPLRLRCLERQRPRSHCRRPHQRFRLSAALLRTVSCALAQPLDAPAPAFCSCAPRERRCMPGRQNPSCQARPTNIHRCCRPRYHCSHCRRHLSLPLGAPSGPAAARDSQPNRVRRQHRAPPSPSPPDAAAG